MKSRAETPFERALIDATLEEYSDVPDCEDKIAIQLVGSLYPKDRKAEQEDSIQRLEVSEYSVEASGPYCNPCGSIGGKRNGDSGSP